MGFDIFSYLFQQYSTKILVISEIGNPQLDSEEIFGEIICWLQCDSMKLDADANGAYNITKKAVPDAFTAEGIEGVALHPHALALNTFARRMKQRIAVC